MKTTKYTEQPGDLSVGRHLRVGGKVTVKSKTTLSDLRVTGVLDAPNVKGVCKGLFETDGALEVAFPHPNPGWYAYVGYHFPTSIYVERDGNWVDSGETYAGDDVDLLELRDKLEAIIPDIHPVVEVESDEAMEALIAGGEIDDKTMYFVPEE